MFVLALPFALLIAIVLATILVFELLSVVTDATSGEVPKVRKQLPEEFGPLFESGSEGKMPAP